MTDKDEQLDRQLRAELDRLDVPPPDPAAKRRAIAMARAAFDSAREGADASVEKNEESAQGWRHWWRLMVGKQPDKENAMIPFKQKLVYSGVAAATVAALAVGISLQYQSAGDLPAIAVPLESDTTGSAAPQGDDGAQQAGGARGDATEIAGRSTAREKIVGETAVAEPASANRQAPCSGRERQYQDRDNATGPRVEAELAADAQVSTFAAPAEGRRAQAIAGAAKQEGSLFAPDHPAPGPFYQDAGRDNFESFDQNAVKLVTEEPVSTFSADVDTASYSFVRRMLNQGVLPQSDAVRAEEMINYFDYDYPLPEHRDRPFRPTVAISDSPWADGRKLMQIGIKGFDIPASEKPRSNLVFLLDVSGSMNSPDKLPLVKQSMELLLSTLDPDDTVAIAVYAGAAGTVLEPTPVKEKQKILDAMRSLSAGGSTAGAQGIRLAYELAEGAFDNRAVNRVILATDGDFNVGITDRRELQSFIERKRDRGIFLSVLGFGQGNYRDAMMQTLAQNGNGVAVYIDTLSEAQKVLVDEATSTLFPIAKDVKLQVEFNPATVAEYRLIGYETRHLNREDFANDAVDAGDIGAGHTVTAIYEFTPVGSDARQIAESRYAPKPVIEGRGDEYAFVKIRYKLPDADRSELISRPVTRRDAVSPDEGVLGREAGFATAVVAFAQLLKGGKYTGDYSYDEVIALAQKTKGADTYGYRTEFIQLVRKAKTATAMLAR